MDAFIVLHGLMLLTCHKATHMCSIMIANTPTHLYTAGSPGNMLPLPMTPKGTFMSDLPLVTTMKDPFGASHPSPLKNRSLVLDGNKATEVESNALYVFHVPIPDEVWATDYASLDTKKALGDPVQANFESDVSSTSFDIPETVILRYKGLSQTFTLTDGVTKITSGKVKDTAGTVLSNALVITSWPNCSMVGMGHDSTTFNKMLSVGGSTPQWKLTETLGYPDGGDKGLGELKLPNSIVAMPSCPQTVQAAPLKTPSKSRAKKAKEGDFTIFNADATGCGVVSMDGN